MAKSSAKKKSRVAAAPVKKPAIRGKSTADRKVSKKPAAFKKQTKSARKKAKPLVKIVKKISPPKSVVRNKSIAKPKLTAKAKQVALKPSKTSKPVVDSVKLKVKNPLLAPKVIAKPAGAAKRTVASKPPIKPVTSLQSSVSMKTTVVAKPSKHSPVAVKPEAFQPAPAVATNQKARKSQIGLGIKELEHYADLLREKRREIVGDMSSMEREALRSGSNSNLSNLPVHMADMGTDNFEQEFTLGLVEKDRNLLREINNALAKIQNGTYGICEGTGLPIGKPRLEAAPWARYSIEYARQREKNGMGVRTL